MKIVIYYLGIGIKSTLHFITGSPLMPGEVTVGFSPNEKGFALRDPDTCSNSFKVPTRYTTYDQ